MGADTRRARSLPTADWNRAFKQAHDEGQGLWDVVIVPGEQIAPMFVHAADGYPPCRSIPLGGPPVAA
jgi:hypothetical protein